MKKIFYYRFQADRLMIIILFCYLFICKTKRLQCFKIKSDHFNHKLSKNKNKNNKILKWNFLIPLILQFHLFFFLFFFLLFSCFFHCIMYVLHQRLATMWHLCKQTNYILFFPRIFYKFLSITIPVWSFKTTHQTIIIKQHHHHLPITNSLKY